MKDRFRIYLSLALLYAAFIFYLSSGLNTIDSEAVVHFLEPIFKSFESTGMEFLLFPFYIFLAYPDQAPHLVYYAGFGFLLYLTIKNSPYRIMKDHPFIFAMIIGTAYGISDEFHQSFVSGRHATFFDLLADSIGLILAQAVIYINRKLSGKKINLSSLDLILARAVIYINRELSGKKIRVSTLDLKLVLILMLISIPFILIPPFNETYLRIILSLPLLLFLPGYIFITVLFPKKGELSSIERFTLSIGLSIAITVFDGFALNYTQWGFRPNSIVVSLSIIVLLFLGAAYLQRRRLGEHAYDFSIEHIRSFYHTLISKETENGPEYDPALEKMLIKTMIIAILLVSAMLVYAKVTKEPEKFTTFYILGSNGKAEDYPAEVVINRSAQLLVGIENYEHQPINYTLRVQLEGRILKEQHVNLKHEEKWLENVSFTPRMTSSIALSKYETRSRLELILLKGNDSYPYRSVHLFVNSSFDINEFVSIPPIKNGNMELTTGWNFTSSSERIRGIYNNNSWISPQHSFEINITSNASTGYGELYQNITVEKESLGILSFFMKDSYSNITDNISMQVMMDGNVVWEGGVGNTTWEKITVPVFFSKNTRLSFRVSNKMPINTTFQVLLDDIKIEPYISKENIPVGSNDVTELINNNPHLEFKIRGMPVAMKGNETIDGSNFPGFYYDIDDNISYEKLNLLFSANNSIGEENATYISTVHGDEISILGTEYKIMNKNDIGELSKVLMNEGSKTLNLNEGWSLETGYSLYLALISSKGDSALLELWKGGKLLHSSILGVGGIFEYRDLFAQNTIFRTKIESINLNSVKVKETELYSDNPVVLKKGDSLGDFEITNISSSNIIMKNPNPIEIKEGAFMLGNYIRFDVIHDLAFPYAASGRPIRGLPQKIHQGNTIDINGSNYQGFYYDFDNMSSKEGLSLYFSDDATVDIGNATYKTIKHGNEINFLGESYWLPNPNRINYVSRFTTMTRTILKNGSLSLDDGYTLSMKERTDNGMEIIIKRNLTDLQKRIINDSNVSTFYKDFIYDIFTTTFKKGRIKSNIIYEVNEELEYWIEYDESENFLLISGKVTAIDDNNVTMIIKQYQLPREFIPGMTFGEFEIESIQDGTILLRNIKPLRFEAGTEIPLLGGVLRIRTSAKEHLLYPESRN